DDTPDGGVASPACRVATLGKDARRVTLALAWRPFQANPPSQFLANPGGASPIDKLEWDGRDLLVTCAPRLTPLVAPPAVRLEPLAAGPVGDWLSESAAGAGPAELVDR